MIKKVTQNTLFSYNTKEILNELLISPAIIAQLWNDGYLSFNPSEKDELNAFEYYELNFVSTLFNSGISLNSIKCFLSTLDKPYCYDISKLYFNFINREWEMLPVPEEQSAEELVEDIIAEENVEKLFIIQERINEYLVKIGKKK